MVLWLSVFFHMFFHGGTGVEALVEDSEGSLGDGNSFLVFVRKALSWPTNSLYFPDPCGTRTMKTTMYKCCWKSGES